MSTNEEPQRNSRPTTFLERLVIEENELSQKLDALKKALESDGFYDKVGAIQFDLLVIQADVMSAYSQILKTRIIDLNSKN